jgi:hypothetical protein
MLFLVHCTQTISWLCAWKLGERERIRRSQALQLQVKAGAGKPWWMPQALLRHCLSDANQNHIYSQTYQQKQVLLIIILPMPLLFRAKEELSKFF